MTCCDEPNCRRKQPLDIYLGPFTEQVYVSTRSRLVKLHEDGTATFSAVERHNVTEQMVKFIRENENWVRAILADAPVVDAVAYHAPLAAGFRSRQKASELPESDFEPAEDMLPDNSFAGEYRPGDEPL